MDRILDYSANTTIFAQLPFDHPLYILYSSGTTGLPNHSSWSGGCLLSISLNTDIILI
ncbi:MAG: hypothetical protein Ct9H300mP28_08630 [Pseudomonadota bacterium]|nr:MAG: hypothetical protein Ct9H300mP28_08630 [Pseudomonadota bacterium]